MSDWRKGQGKFIFSLNALVLNSTFSVCEGPEFHYGVLLFHFNPVGIKLSGCAAI